MTKHASKFHVRQTDGRTSDGRAHARIGRRLLTLLMSLTWIASSHGPSCMPTYVMGLYARTYAEQCSIQSHPTFTDTAAVLHRRLVCRVTQKKRNTGHCGSIKGAVKRQGSEFLSVADPAVNR